MTLSFRSTITAILVRAVAYAAIATPASAHTCEYCSRDPESYESCDFDTLVRCQATSSGRGGECYRDPFPGGAGAAHACAPIRNPARAVPARNN
jgi:Protein of unknown function (DUF3551)